MLRELGGYPAALVAVLVLSLLAGAVPTHASDDLQTWRFKIEGMT